MAYVLVINSGSSSIKFQIVDPTAGASQEPFVSGLVEQIGESSGRVTVKHAGQKFVVQKPIATHGVGLQETFKLLDAKGIGPTQLDIVAAGHRVVHGGMIFSAPELISDPVVEQIRALIPLAPLHNPANIDGIEVARALLPILERRVGRILINGQDLRTVNVRSLRRALGIVPQDTLLFNETIAYNIAYSRPEATRDQIVQAARGARVHDFIESLPDGYETPVGERGVKLSGGERQRIAIARAILKNPSILVFDEATSALDTRTERAIQAELERLSRGRTTLIIAHRLSTIRDAEQIVVLDAGRVAERGTHAELLARGGAYAALLRAASALGEDS